MKLMNFKIKAKSESPTKTVVTARDFKMVIDEPKMLGGENLGANPVEYLLGALSGCLNVVGHIVAREMGFDFNGMEIDIEGGLNPAKFMGKPSDERTGYQFIHAKIKLNTEMDSETLKKWVKEVEERCPVSDNIGNATPITISLK
ncbi:MAG: OsmC family protein [Candidatus Tenebribacter mawsonii]|nr:OsmC family protein [Candidatus Tenebribacter mawsonii]